MPGVSNQRGFYTCMYDSPRVLGMKHFKTYSEAKEYAEYF